MVRPAAPAVISVERFFELSLLGFVASGYFAVVSSGYLDVPTAALTAAGLLLRALLITGAVRFTLSARVQAALTLAYIAFYPLDYAFISGEFLTATVHLVFFLAVIKILTAKSHRDHIFVAVIGFLELLAASVLSTNVNFFIAMALFLLFGVATFSSGEIRRSTRKSATVVRHGLGSFHWRLAALSIYLCLGILILTGGLFFLLPRTAQAAFQHLVPQRYHIPGFSSEMRLGEVGLIQPRNTPVMHVRVNNAEGPVNLKWRGIALSRFDGKRWYNTGNGGARLTVEHGLLRLTDTYLPQHPSRILNYDVQVNAIASDALFFALPPDLLQINVPAVMRTATDSYRVPYGTSDGLRYTAWGYLDQRAEAPGPAPLSIRETYLQLPALDPRIPELARKIVAGARSDEARARALESFLRTSYGYTTELPREEVGDPLAHFLFERRKGHCEYFASALTILLRTIGIPSRVVNGFQSGIFNPISGWYVIRASDAHSWVEAWLPGHGWSTFDATPPAADAPKVTLWARLGFCLDAAETFWDEWVLNYDLDRQLTLASKMESSGRNFSTHWFDHVRLKVRRGAQAAIDGAKRQGPIFAAMIALLAAAAYCLPRIRRWWLTRTRVREAQRGGAQPSDATLLYARMLAALGRRGFEKPPWLTPAEFARLLPASEAAALVEEFTTAYNSLRFGGDQSAGLRMVSLLEELDRAAA